MTEKPLSEKIKDIEFTYSTAGRKFRQALEKAISKLKKERVYLIEEMNGIEGNFVNIKEIDKIFGNFKEDLKWKKKNHWVRKHIIKKW